MTAWEAAAPRVLPVIVGPTAVGKTELALELAEQLDGEIVSADSRQIYRGMDIATAKPTPAEQARVRHHLIDVVAPDASYTVSEYQADAYAATAEIAARGKQPLLVGGTGLYIRAVAEGLQIPGVPPNPTRRAELETEGAAALYARLQALDPTAAARILPGNTRRVIRALEVIEATGRPMSEQQVRRPPPFPILRIGLTRPRPELYARVDARIERMVQEGVVDEVRRLVDAGLSYDLPAMTSLGYRELGQYLRAEIPLAEAIRLFKSNTRKFIRHQYNWFRPTDPTIDWFDLSVERVAAVVQAVRGRVEAAAGERSG